MEAATYTRSHGITPSSGRMEFAPQPHAPARIGTLVLSDGFSGIELDQCLLDTASTQRDGAGFAVSVSFLDRRWKWRHGEVYGRYNIRDAEGEIIEETRKTPAELARMLLDAMNEWAVDVGALPPEPMPEVEWDGDNPADELAELLDVWGCVIGLDFADTTRIWKRGVGAPAPQGPIEIRAADVDPPEPPDSIRVLFAPTIVQARLELEAVGRDTDGTVKPIDELSYKPEGGWETQSDLFRGVTDEKAIVYCTQSVFRWYRVVIPPSGLTIPGVAGSQDIVSVRQILPIHDRLVETFIDPKDLERKPKPMKVYGTYWVRNTGTPKNSSKESNWECKEKFRVLGEIGVIAFDEPVKKFDESTADNPAGYRFYGAELFADVAFGVAHSTTRAYHRWAYTLPTGLNNGTGPEPISAKEEGGLKVYQQRESPTADTFEWAHASKGSPDHLNSIGEKYAQQARAKYVTARGESLTYSGIQPVPIDGLNVQVAFSVSRSGASTQLSRARETAALVIPYQKRREREKARRELKRAERRGQPIRFMTFIEPHQGER